MEQGTLVHRFCGTPATVCSRNNEEDQVVSYKKAPVESTGELVFIFQPKSNDSHQRLSANSERPAKSCRPARKIFCSADTHKHAVRPDKMEVRSVKQRKAWLR